MRLVANLAIVFALISLMPSLLGLALLKRQNDRTNQLVMANRERIADIQQSRVESCRRTYEGVRETLRPFFPPEAQRTERQQNDLDRFNANISRLKNACVKQTKP